MTQVFCEKCKFLENNGGMYESPVWKCSHPNNQYLYKINWLRKWYRPIRKPKHINKNNDCLWGKSNEPKTN